MDCRTCKQPLRVISGGQQSDEGTTTIKTVNIFGCINKQCADSMVEQHRITTENPSFTE